MDLYPLFNSLRIAAISTALIFFLGIAAAYYVARLPRLVKGVLDVILTLPLVLPPPWWATSCCGCWGQSAPSGFGCWIPSACG